MNRLIEAGAVLALAMFLSGCCTVYETDPPVLDKSNKFNLNLKLEGFELVSLRPSGVSFGSGSATAYNWKTGTTATAYGNSTAAYYEYCPDGEFANSTADLFEALGFNIRSQHPDLIIVGRVGNGGFPWKSGLFWARDVPVFLVAVPTAMAVLSCTRENDVEVIVYGVLGKRVASYYSKKEYTAFSIGFPFANFANSKAYEWFGDRQSAFFALIDCVNQFSEDLKKGKFNQIVKIKGAHTGCENGASKTR